MDSLSWCKRRISRAITSKSSGSKSADKDFWSMFHTGSGGTGLLGVHGGAESIFLGDVLPSGGFWADILLSGAFMGVM